MKMNKYFYTFLTILVITLATQYLLTNANANTVLFEHSVIDKSIAQVPNSKFGLPIECNLDQDCFILLYSDRDPSPKAVDFGCGRQTYDSHKGTDFAIPDEKTMARGVPVTAVAPGKVLRVLT